MVYGYLRVSSDTQDVNSQKQGVEKYAADHAITIDEYITDEGVSGGKDPDKRNLGPLLKKIKKGDTIIASEISRLGRDLYMVMDILHFCMERGAIIHTVKDNFTLGNDIQSKVLAFAFGLSAEIERQMIRQRTKEGLRQRMKIGVLVGRPSTDEYVPICSEEDKQKILEQAKWGVPFRRLATNFGVDRSTMLRWLAKWGVSKSKLPTKKKSTANGFGYKENDYKIVPLEESVLIEAIEADKTIPEIAELFKSYSYEQIYDTILCTKKYNQLYRKHGQKKLVKSRK